MPSSAPLKRQIKLAQFPGFARNVALALANAGIAPPDFTATCAAHLSARCALCEARVDGRELAALVAAEELPETSPLRRLAQGYCVSESCKSSYYEFTCAPHPTVDWLAISTEIKVEAPSPSEGLGELVLRQSARTLREQLTWKLTAAILVLAALLLWRQWWTGGSIPYFREAQSFRSEGALPDAMSDDSEPKEPGTPPVR